MTEETYIKTITINDYFELQDMIQGRGEYSDLREDYIFRGISKKCYKLIPSSLRENNIINYIDSEYAPVFKMQKETAIRYGLDIKDKIPNKQGNYDFKLNKYDKFENGRKIEDEPELNRFKLIKEMEILFYFCFYSDKYGLKIPMSQNVRKQLLSSSIHIPSIWPKEEYFEIISLAQHYGLPTRALDWTYDYKVSLYFAVKNVLSNKFSLEDDNNDGIIWALNYGPFRSNDEADTFKIRFYRPEYNTNPNLNAQNGLFSIVVDYEHECDERPLNEIIITELENNKKSVNDKIVYEIKGLDRFTIEDDEKIFYRFIIPKEIKAEILEQLYIDGYSEEYLFPGYGGVAKHIKNKAKLDEVLKKF